MHRGHEGPAKHQASVLRSGLCAPREAPATVFASAIPCLPVETIG
jgi:hypothetical protein